MAELPLMLCLPHAGASAAVYSGWSAPLRGVVDVAGVELPGRGRRRREPPVTTMAALLSAVGGEVDAIARSGRPYLLYGHSLGSLVACALAHVLEAAGRGPTVLVVSGRNGPSRPTEAPPVHRRPDDELVALLRLLGGTPPAFVDDPDLRRLVLAPLRADLTVAETYAHDPPSRLRCPILSLQGEHDPVVSRDGVAAWAAETEGPCETVWCPGGHFFLQEPGAVAVTLRSRLADAAARRLVLAPDADGRLAA